MPGQGLYLYGFTRRGAAAPDGVATLPADGVAALVAPVALDDFEGESGDRNFQDPQWLVPRALDHERVLGAVLGTAPVLPVRFGAVFTGTDAVHDLLHRHAARVADFLARVEGREEWSFKAALDPDRAAAWLAEHDPELASRRRALPAAPGARYLLEKRLLADVRQRLAPWSRGVADGLATALAVVAPEVRRLPLRGPVRDGAAAEPILNAAALVPSDNRAALRDWAEAQAAAHAACGVVVTCAGPFPPYSFCPALDEVGP